MFHVKTLPNPYIQEQSQSRIETLAMLTREQMIERMHKGWRSGRPFTNCGSGSLPENTSNVREALPRWCATYGIGTVNDAGAGDMRWMDGMEWAVDYRAFDLIPLAPIVTPLDITTDTMPPCDLIVCRLVLNHLDAGRVEMALERFRASGKYLAATQFDNPRPHPQTAWLDLRLTLGAPLDSVPDIGVSGCTFALWRL
jgi:hypothetical protein